MDHRSSTIEATIDRIMDLRQESKPNHIEMIKNRAYMEGYNDGFEEGHRAACDACITELVKMLIKERDADT